MPAQHDVPASKVSDNTMRIVERRYLKKNQAGEPVESLEGMFRRVAENISQAELIYDPDESGRKTWEDVFFGMMSRAEFLPNSPTLMNAGTDIQQLSACFVLPVEDSMEGIFDAIKHTALIHKSGGGTGFSFSRIRPRDDVVNSTRGVSSGPISFMNVFDAATETVKQGGRRRGANMAILRVDHPDIVPFITAKAESTRLNNFNISVAVTDRFMQALAAGESYELLNPRSGEAVDTLDATTVFELIIEQAWQNGEPGIVYIDRLNRDNPTPALGDIESTNPCGEQPLLPYESCNLGSVNLAKFVTGEPGSGTLDADALAKTVRNAVRFLDDVIDMNRYPLPEISEMTRGNRKIGLGVMGFAEMLILMGVTYDSEDAPRLAETVMRIIRDAAREGSNALAAERGAFPNFSSSALAERGDNAQRNATVTTIAPTGSISIIAETSSGVEPLFALAYRRRAVDDEFIEVNRLFERVAKSEGFWSDDLMDRVARSGGVGDIDDVPARWRELFKTAHDVSPESHVRIQAAFQKYTDNAVSKTVNFPGTATRDDVAQVFRLAYDLECKGVTIYRDGSRENQVLSTEMTTTASAGPVSKKPKPRPDVVSGLTRRVGTGCGNLYVTINRNGRDPFEVFAQIGKAGGCAASQTEAIGRLISLSLRAGVDSRAVVKQLRGVRCPSPGWNRGEKVASCADGIGQALDRYLDEMGGGKASDVAEDPRVDRLVGVCTDCGSELEFEGGCVVCRNCGFTRC